jgi:hypothetical protein
MNSFLMDIIANIIGNVFAWLLLGIATLYFVKQRSKARFERFFGLVYRRKVIVYLSNLWDQSKTTGAKPFGSILSWSEFQASQTISRLFGVSPFSIPELVRGFVDAFFIGRRVEVEVNVSSMDDGFDAHNILIVVGATTKNRVRRVYASRTTIHVIIEGEPIDIERDAIDIHSNPLKDRFEVIAGKRKGEKTQHNGLYELSIVEKVREKNRLIFFCLGTTGEGSRAAVEYLARNWEEMWKKYKERSFALCLWFDKKDIRSPNPTWEPSESDEVH